MPMAFSLEVPHFLVQKEEAEDFIVGTLRPKRIAVHSRGCLGNAMGRRHFLFGPPPRALQGSILEGCQVRNDAPSALVDSEHVQTRRHFNLEEGTRGATTSSFEIASKRRFDALEHKEHGREVIESYYGRKHLLGPECHMQGALQVKSAEVQRRRQETSQPTLRRGDTPQRRHLVSQDHLLWSGAVSGRCADQAPPQGLRRSEPSPTLDSQVANLLVDPAREAMAQAAPLLCYGPRLNGADAFAPVCVEVCLQDLKLRSSAELKWRTILSGERCEVQVLCNRQRKVRRSCKGDWTMEPVCLVDTFGSLFQCLLWMTQLAHWPYHLGVPSVLRIIWLVVLAFQ
ncbi:unnamed protein product [Durusdinium trenchii]|uniref:Uncharacterized protein n=2 Tax=Durusdinium trenchii TaxID=1381693 RepID=A0ABP0T2E8_9DINO